MPIVIDHVLPDPTVVRELLIRGTPYWTVQRYVKNLSEMAALSDAAKRGRQDRPMFIAPWFRGNWAYGEVLVDGAEVFLEHEAFRDEAQEMFEGGVVVPQIVYVNLNPPIARVDPGHVDIPAFRGIDRTGYPVWLLATMLKSGLFDRWYIPSVTAVAWYYEGEGGGFTYWPDGPDRSPISRPCIGNSAVVGDNDYMFHRVEAVGPDDRTMPKGLTLESQLSWSGDAWEVIEQGNVLARYEFEAVRVSVSWKAQVFADAEQQALYQSHADDLTLDQVVEMLLTDLAARETPIERPADPLHDRNFIESLNAAYRRAPTVWD
ncbi:MAG: hypothetical protein DRH30_01685 [Deltaproteobacteria bacterium]|nr:MAG: hypothetical protein DRH30_01685 [Deltaproteobacteria bacterium]